MKFIFADPSVPDKRSCSLRRTVYSELLQMFGKSSDQKLDKAPQGECSEHWEVLVDLLLEMKKAQQHDQKFKFAASTDAPEQVGCVFAKHCLQHISCQACKIKTYMSLMPALLQYLAHQNF